MSLDEKIKELSTLLGREASITQVSGEKRGFVIEYFNFNTPPPPVGDTEEEACTLFVEWYARNIKENSDAANN